MNENKFCFPKNLLFLVFGAMLVLTLLFYVNKLLLVKTSISSKAQVTGSNSLPSNIYLKDILNFCQIKDVEDINVKITPGTRILRYPMVFDFYKSWFSKENTYAMYGAYMTSWFVDEYSRFKPGTTKSSQDIALISKSNQILRTIKSPTCGVWEVAMRTLIDNYNTSDNYGIGSKGVLSLFQIRFFSANAIFYRSSVAYHRSPPPATYKLLTYKDNYTTAIAPQGLCPLTGSTNCLSFEKILPQLGLTSRIYDIETNKSIPILYYTFQQSEMARPASHPNLDKFLVEFSGKNSMCGKEYMGEKMACGIVYVNIPEALGALVENFSDPLQKMTDKACQNNWSIQNSPFCGFDVRRIQDPSYFVTHLIESQRGVGSIDPKVITAIGNLRTFYSMFSSAISFVSAIMPNGDEVKIGDDFSSLKKTDQRESLTRIFDAFGSDTYYELEVGHGGIYTLCQSGHVCIKTDLMVKPDEGFTLNKLRGEDFLGIGYSAFYTLDVPSMPAPQKGYDLIYMIAPYPLTYESTTNYTELMISDVSTKLAPGGKLVIVYDPLLNSEFNPSNISTEDAFVILQSRISEVNPNCNSNCFASGYVFQNNSNGQASLQTLFKDLYFFKFMDSEFFLDMFAAGQEPGYMLSKVKALVFTKPK